MTIIDKPKFRFKLNGKTLVIIDWANVNRWKDSLGWEVDPQRLFEYLSGYKDIEGKRFYCSEGALNRLPPEFRTAGFEIMSKEGKFVPVSLAKSHFRKIVEELFDVLDGIKTTNSGISTKLYELREKIKSRLANHESDEDQKVYDSAYGLIEELDAELKKLNLNIGDLQKHLSEPVMRPKCDFDVEIARDVFNLSSSFTQLIIFSGDGDFAALAEDQIEKGKKVVVVFAPGNIGKEYEKLTRLLTERKMKYRLFLCSTLHLKEDILSENNIPTDLSAGRDSAMLADSNAESQASVDSK